MASEPAGLYLGASKDYTESEVDLCLDGDSAAHDANHQEPTTSHYVDKKNILQCNNSACQIFFSLTVRPHHCRRCGEVFCTNCLRYRRRLNKLAQLDPEGLPWKVCRPCFEVELLHVTLGSHRSHTVTFLELRRGAKENRRQSVCSEQLQDVRSNLYPAFWRRQFSIDVLSESNRLLCGFKSAIAKSEAKKVIGEMRNIVKVPHWQKSTYWKLEKCVEFCRVCHGKLGYRKKLRNCKICGMSLCKRCAFQELLVYMDEFQHENGTTLKKPKLAIIRLIGSPEVEPAISVLLHMCGECRNHIKEKQINDPDWFEEKPRPPDVATRLSDLDEEIRVVREQISFKLTEYNEMLDPPNTCYPEEMKHHMVEQQDLSTLEQMKAELGACIKKLETLCRELRSIHMQSGTRGEAVLVNNYVKGKYDFYIETKGTMDRLMKRNKSIVEKRKTLTTYN